MPATGEPRADGMIPSGRDDGEADGTGQVHERATRTGRRRFLRAALTTGVAVTAPGFAAGKRGRRCPSEPPGPRGVPGIPKGVTDWGEPRALGNGTVRTYTTVTPSGRPGAHGVYLERAALRGLPSGDGAADPLAPLRGFPNPTTGWIRMSHQLF